MNNLEFILFWTLGPVLSWLILWFSLTKIPSFVNRYFDWNRSKKTPLIQKIIVAYIIGCIATFFYSMELEL